jgi:predicted transcriptional regulator
VLAPGRGQSFKLPPTFAISCCQVKPARNSHVYKASRSEAQTQRQLVGDLVERAFGRSALKPVTQALASTKTSTQKLTEIRTLIERLERERGADREVERN